MKDIKKSSEPDHTFVVLGNPTAWTTHKGFGRRSYSYHGFRKGDFRLQLLEKKPEKMIEGPCEVKFFFELPVPKFFPKGLLKQLENGDRIWHTKRPDLTNLQKFAEDCLIKLVINDDNQVVICRSVKYYSFEPKTIIEVTEIC